MPLSHRRAQAAIRLPEVLIIGFTGHRKLENEEQCRSAITDFLRERKQVHPGIVWGVSSAAAGGDQVFCEACLELGIPIRVLLPKPVEEFHRDFEIRSWERTRKILDRALSVEVTGDARDSKEQYYDCGIQTVSECQLLVALWDGEPSRGRGGTQEIVTFAEKTGHPVAWIHSATGDIQLLNHTPEVKSVDRLELDFENTLPDCGVAAADESPRAHAQAWLRKMDENANRYAPQARRLASIPVVYTAAAAVLSGVAPEIPNAAPWLGVSAVLGIVAIAMPAVLRLHERQALWARTRVAAEVSRSVLALWESPGLYKVVGPEVLPELAGMVRALNYLKMQHAGHVSLEQFKQDYQRERVADQADYFSRHALGAERLGRRYGMVSWICGILATAIAAGYLVSQAHWIAIRELPHQWIALVMSALFEVATMAGAFALMKDASRRRRRYRELSSYLGSWSVHMNALHTWTSVTQVAERIERALLVELLEWRSIVLGVSHHHGG